MFERHEVFIKLMIVIVVLFVVALICYFAWTYNRSFVVHQDTLQWAHAHNISAGATFKYKIHIGHDGTTLEPVLIKEMVKALSDLPKGVTSK